jgi:hypothetical protein
LRRNGHPYLYLPPSRDCVAMHEWPILVISSGARDLAFSATCEEKISRLGLEMTIATQSLEGGRGKKARDMTVRLNHLLQISRMDEAKRYPSIFMVADSG